MLTCKTIPHVTQQTETYRKGIKTYLKKMTAKELPYLFSFLHFFSFLKSCSFSIFLGDVSMQPS